MDRFCGALALCWLVGCAADTSEEPSAEDRESAQRDAASLLSESKCFDGSCLECAGEADGLLATFIASPSPRYVNAVDIRCSVGDDVGGATVPNVQPRYMFCDAGAYYFEGFEGAPDGAALFGDDQDRKAVTRMGFKFDCVGKLP